MTIQTNSTQDRMKSRFFSFKNCCPEYQHCKLIEMESFIRWCIDCHDSKELNRITGLHQQSPYHFAWKPSLQVSQTLWPICPSHMIAATTLANKYWYFHSSDCRNTLTLCTHAHFPDLWHQPRLANIICIWSWRLFVNNPATGS